ncbi:dihydroorotate dehydrogenase [Caldilinea aerophila]|uniref:Dihydroorotate dehydrogenase n=1 Tax=Caldilinea aerophila (strain DSM 14535 / JCM 11387 / NBRC 104270 / STL-6-O1) TaxID=926550 RepID=I0I5K6_CALAS|nr:dihydroorotate dehydrogenase [Caldilinea aerophila]BAM00544.1 dihydroorotate dehydrogenase [Caldilinea aerophila DSM 14535 = NBRC 104270]
MAQLSTRFLNFTLPTPLVLASGIWGTTVSLLVRAAEAGCGAVTAKSCGPTPRAGHVNPSCLDWGHGLINAIGLANPGAQAEVELLRAAKARLQPMGVALIASIFAGPPEEFGTVAAVVAQAAPDLIEVNISCPNVHSEFGEPYAGDPDAAAEVTGYVKDAVQETGIPVVIKLAPNVPSIGRIARAVVSAGADALCVINTMPGMVIDAESGQPILANRSGGLSGPALKPIALKCVYDVRKACPEIPIIGTGGVTTGLDAVEMLMAGATAVGVGSAIYYRGPSAISLICNELRAWLDAHRIASVEDIQNCAHRERRYSLTPTGAPIPLAH